MINAGPKQEGEVELNLAPIIDCFTVLIIYLLVSASFLTVGAFNIGISAVSEAAPADPTLKTTPTLTVELQTSKSLKIHLGGAALATLEIPAKTDGKWDLEELNKKIQSFKEKWPLLTEGSVTADDSILYEEIIPALESLRQILDKVYLGES